MERNPSMIEVKNLSKHYQVHEREAGFIASWRSLFNRKFRTVKAVDGISFHISEGEIVGFLGPNGAGKTTTMKMLTGLLYPTSGEVRVDGFVPSEHKKDFKKQISLVMGQKSQLMWDIPASETFQVNKVIYEIPDEAYRKTLHELVELLDLGDVINKPVRQLSLGERMKCELAAALIHRPQIVFLDEPTIGLDVNMQVVLRDFIRNYNVQYKATILLTSHYMADVTALCERVIVIAKGQLLYDGAISQLVHQFAPNKQITMQFATFVGEQELLETLQSRAKKVYYDFPKVVVEVLRVDVSDVSSLLLNRFNIIDLTIEDPSMESIISQTFEAGKQE
jgi:ABC-2 type transport system ATP-binding protein